jgi:hypothetical protein
MMPLLAVYDHGTRCTFAHVCPKKGVCEETIKALKSDLEWLGYKRITFKSDQEPSILALKRQVSDEMQGIEFVMEESPVSAHAANGHVEGAVRRIAGQVRTILDQTQMNYKAKIETTHPLLAWAVMHAASMITSFSLGRDGRTPWELARGKSYKRRLPPFAETLHDSQGPRPSRQS